MIMLIFMWRLEKVIDILSAFFYFMVYTKCEELFLIYLDGLGGVLYGKSLATYPEGSMNAAFLNDHGCGKQEANHGPSLIYFGKKPANFSCFLRQQPWRHHNRFSVISCSNSQSMLIFNKCHLLALISLYYYY